MTPQEMHNLAVEYHNAGDYQNAIHWYEKAAEYGFPASFEGLGYLYQHGDGVVQDVPMAILLYQNGAELGDSNCMMALGWIFYNGEIGVPSDECLARRWFEMAKAAGNYDAPKTLSILFRSTK